MMEAGKTYIRWFSELGIAKVPPLLVGGKNALLDKMAGERVRRSANA